MVRPNPAEVCNQRGWKAGHPVETNVGPRTIAFIGKSYVIVETDDGAPIRYYDEDISGWAEVKPRVTVEPLGHVDFEIRVGHVHDFVLCSNRSAHERYGDDRSRELARIGAEAIRAAIEKDLGIAPPEAATGPWRVYPGVRQGTWSERRVSTAWKALPPVVIIAEDSIERECGAEASAEFMDAVSEFAANKLNEIYARKEGGK